MRVILIEEGRFKELLELLKLQSENDKKDDPVNSNLINSIHRKFHYELVRWMQSHGVSLR